MYYTAKSVTGTLEEVFGFRKMIDHGGGRQDENRDLEKQGNPYSIHETGMPKLVTGQAEI